MMNAPSIYYITNNVYILINVNNTFYVQHNQELNKHFTF